MILQLAVQGPPKHQMQVNLQWLGAEICLASKCGSVNNCMKIYPVIFLESLKTFIFLPLKETLTG